LNAAAFYSRYEDIQLTLATSSPIGVIVVTGNAGRAAVDGLELDLAAAVSERLTLVINLGYLDNEYRDLEQGASVSPSARLPVSPRWTFSAGLEHTLPLASSARLRTHIDYSYTSRYNYFFDNAPLSWQSGFALWNARLTFEPNASWHAAAYLLNATDRRHSSFREDILTSAGTAIVWPAKPREWGVELEFRW